MDSISTSYKRRYSCSVEVDSGSPKKNGTGSARKVKSSEGSTCGNSSSESSKLVRHMQTHYGDHVPAGAISEQDFERGLAHSTPGFPTGIDLMKGSRRVAFRIQEPPPHTNLPKEALHMSTVRAYPFNGQYAHKPYHRSLGSA